jgi:ribosomal protein L37AE/L43A
VKLQRKGDYIDASHSMLQQMFARYRCPICGKTMECVTSDGYNAIYWCVECQLTMVNSAFFDIEGNNIKDVR